MQEKQSQEAFNREFKLSRRGILLDTILSLLPDLTEQKRLSLLGDGTPEELAEFCFQIYDEEFDRYVKTLSIGRSK